MPSKPSKHSRVTANVKKSDIIPKFDGKVEIDHAKNWDIVMIYLCDDLKIPIITDRKSLKKMHNKIDDMYPKIENMYRTSPPSQIDYVRGGAAMIFCRLFMDSVLRDRLFEKGVLDLILPLFDSHRTHQLAAFSLLALCHSGNYKVRHAVAEKSNDIAKFIRKSLDDYKLVHFGIATISLCIKSLIEEQSKHGTEGIMILEVFEKSIDVTPILEAIVESVKRHHAEATGIILYHAVDLLSIVGMFSPEKFKAYPPAIRFLVAGLRSKNWVTRGKCLHGLIVLHSKEAKHAPDDIDPRILQEVFKNGTPARFTEIYDSYESERDRELVTASQCAAEYHNAISNFIQTHNLCVLGAKQAELILRSEYSILEGNIGWVNSDGSIGPSNSEIPVGFPHKWLFKKFTASLPLCAQALRSRNFRGDIEKANILDLKSLLLKGSDDGAVLRIAESALKRSPNQAFFHYVVSKTAHRDRALLAAKKGLECTDLTPSLKWLLLERLVHLAGIDGAGFFFRNPSPTKPEWKEGMALLKCAYVNAKKFIMTGPPDSRLMKPVAYWLVLLTMVMGDNLSDGRREFKDTFEAIAVCTKFWDMIGVPITKSRLYLAQDAALKNFDAAQAEFSAIFEASEQSKEADDGFSAPTDDELVAWFERINLGDDHVYSEDVEQPTEPLVDNRQYHIEAGKLDFVMSLCSWCNNPSAALQKCDGCTNVQYCGKDCQRLHWNALHREHCKS